MLAKYRYLLLLIVLASIWSSAFMFIKIGVATLPPLTLAAGRIVLAAAVLYGYLRLAGLRLPTSGRVWAVLFVLGLVGNVLPFTLIGWGEERIDSGLAAILMAVMPLETLLLAHFFTSDERLSATKVIGITVGFLGIVVLVGPEVLKGLGSDLWRQLGVAAGATGYAIANIFARRLPPAPPAVYAAAVMICASLLIVPFSLAWDMPWLLMPDVDSVLSVVYLGLFPTALAMIIYFHLIADKGATFVAFNNYLVPAMGVVWGVVFLGEMVTPRALGALAMILIGITIANFRLAPLRAR